MINKINTKIFTIFFLFSFCQTQQLGVGDTIPSTFGLPLCANDINNEVVVGDSLFLNYYNGATNESGQYYVLWLNLFTSWCGICQTEAPITQGYYNTYQYSGLVNIGVGFQWDDPYSCEGWASAFGISYPILDDISEEAFGLFGDCCIPHNVIINHEMEIVYTAMGFEEEEVSNAIEEALESCGVLCLPSCSEIPGDIDGTYSVNNEPIIDVLDLIRLADIIFLDSGIDDCLAITGDLSTDGVVNNVDVLAFASMLSLGEFNNN